MFSMRWIGLLLVCFLCIAAKGQPDSTKIVSLLTAFWKIAPGSITKDKITLKKSNFAPYDWGTHFIFDSLGLVHKKHHSKCGTGLLHQAPEPDSATWIYNASSKTLETSIALISDHKRYTIIHVDSNTLILTKEIQAFDGLNGTWTLIEIRDLIHNTKTERPDDRKDSEQMKFTFSDTLGNGTLHGFTTTNQVSGKYSIQGNKITVHPFGGTKVGEIGWGSEIWSAFNSATSYNRTASHLNIVFENGAKELHFVRTE